MASQKQKAKPPVTTAQHLANLIKSCRQKMRKDKGLSTDLDRLPTLTWIMFLKFLDDMEQLHEQKARLAGRKYRPPITPPYRWRDWAADEKGMTGDDLLRFVTQEEAVGPTGKKGPGLFTYLRGLHGSNGGDRRDVIARVFDEVACRMQSGYTLRDILNAVNEIHFNSTEEVFTLSHFYESMLKEMRDAAGENGEFYTPRPVVRFVVQVMNPRLAETVLDPACGTGGFLAAAYEHMEKQCRTVEDRRILQKESIFGVEAKPLPFLLVQMNLLLHGMDVPQVTYRNALEVPLREIGERDRVDIILTNPPFGGEEERGVLHNFPEDKQTAETALLFLQLIMRKLKRPPKPGRGAVVVPDGVLFGDGVCARIKEQLLKEFNLHTVVRLPKGVFSPYTDIQTNLLFFDRSGPTGEIWYYEHPLPNGRRQYTKTNPLRFEEFEECFDWWKSRKENDRAWRVRAEDVLKYDGTGSLISADLDIKNPHAKPDLEHRPPEKLAEDILNKEQQIAQIVEELRRVLAQPVQ